MRNFGDYSRRAKHVAPTVQFSEYRAASGVACELGLKVCLVLFLTCGLLMVGRGREDLPARRSGGERKAESTKQDGESGGWGMGRSGAIFGYWKDWASS